MTSLPEEPDLVEILKGLSAEEQAIIRPVLERDLEFQRREKERLRTLRSNLDLEKSDISSTRSSVYSMATSESQDSMTSSNISSSVSPSSPSRACSRCSAKLGFILNAGSKCKKCQQLVCDSCRVMPSDSKKIIYCPLCYKERELQAASGEWVQNNGDDVSQHLLIQMKRVHRDRSQSAKPGTTPVYRNSHHAPPISRRNMTLPSLAPMTTLSVPSEDEAIGRQFRGDITRRFWGGSPSPRSPSPRPGSTGLASISSSPPNSANSLLADTHPREVIGSPSPRSLNSFPFSRNSLPSPTVPVANNIQVPTTEIAPPTPTTHTAQSPMAEARRHVFSNSPKSPFNGIERQYLHPVDAHRVSPRHHGQQMLTADQIPTPIEEDPFEEWHRIRKYDSPRSLSQASDITTLECMDQMNNNSPKHVWPNMAITSPTHPSAHRSIYKSASRDTTSYTSSVDASSQFDTAPRFLGEIQLKISYSPSDSTLHIHIVQCRSLPHYGQHKPSPYVKIFLLGEFSTDMSAKFKTSARKSAVDPEFHEIIKVPNVVRHSLMQRRVLVGVWHRDALGHNAPIGETIISLANYNWNNDRPIWFPLEAKASRISLNPVHYRVLVNLQLHFHLRDRERGLGHLTLRLETIRWPAVLPAVLYHHPISIQIKYYFNEKRLVTIDSRRRQQILATSSESQLNWNAEVANQNINDLHLRSLKISIRARIGRFGYKSIANQTFNDYLHRTGRSIYHPCDCDLCQPWQQLISSHRCSLELPFTLDKL